MKQLLKQIHITVPGGIVLAVVAVGLYSLHVSLAATPYATIAATAGQLTNGAVIQADTTGAGEQYVSFGANPYSLHAAGPSTLVTGASGSFTESASDSLPNSNMIIDFEVYNSSGTQVDQNYTQNVNLTATPQNFNFQWTPTTTGTYSISLGIFTSSWTNVDWVNNALSITASAAPSCPSGETGTPPNCIQTTPLITAVSVNGNQLVNQNGKQIQLRGVDQSGTEYACSQGWGMTDSPLTPASITQMLSWGVNVVRLPLNEDCWLGINGVNASYSGSNYQNLIANYVSELNAAGIVAILDLHWNAPGTTLASGQLEMADSDHSPAFWTSVATTFKNNHDVIFDLYNEPNTISWSCWENGCQIPATNVAAYQSAGMQQLVSAVRATGATQPIMLGGLAWANDVSNWLAYEPIDPDKSLIASVHMYNFNSCSNETCWAQTITPVAAKVPVITGEIGENDCSSSFITSYMDWADTQNISYLGWSWNQGTCGSGGPFLISNYTSFTPQPGYGTGFQAHLQALAK